MFIRLAWRNIWRNSRRTFVILTAIVIGVWSMVFLGALMRGIESGMIRNGIKTLTGHLQIHAEGYDRDPVIDYRIDDPRQLDTILRKVLPSDARWTHRIRVNAVASNARHSAGVTLVGILPSRESEISFIGGAVRKGDMLAPDSRNNIIIGQALLDKFETRIGHKLVLMSQDADNEIASHAFKITGVFQTEMEATEKQYVFVPLAASQQMLKVGNDISEVSVLLADDPINGSNSRYTADALQKKLADTHYKIQTWRELLPMLNAYLDLSDGFIYIWYVVVFVAMGFGIVNTTLMAIFERMREFGILKSLGMKPGWIIREVLTESCLLLAFGCLIGSAGGLLSVLLLSRQGIDLSAMAAGAEFAGMSRVIYPDIMLQDFFMANGVVVALGLVVSLYPAIKAARFKPVEALAYT